MADIMTKEQRHKCMVAVKGKDTKPEMIVRRYLHGLGFRYGLHNKKLPGTPDLVLRRHKTVIFVNGCFWHGHENCKYSHIPKSNIEFWQMKICRNRARDLRNVEALRKLGWHVIIIWECQLKTEELRKQTFAELYARLNGEYIIHSQSFAEAAEAEVPYGL